MVSLNSGIGTPEFRDTKNILFSGIDLNIEFLYFYNNID
jgi:hypothetical protein